MPEDTSKSQEIKTRSEHLELLKQFLYWIPVSTMVGILAGTASAFLVWSLNVATKVRQDHHWLMIFLAPVGVVVALLYHYYGRDVEAGNNLILETIQQDSLDPRKVLKARMTPLILLATFLSHVFGASVGREGTALQTGASLADQLTRPLGLGYRERRILLMAGVSAGFGSVFGTPLAGAVFGVEVLAFGSISYEALVPCFLASFIGDLVTRAWGIRHEVYVVDLVPKMSVLGIGVSIVAGVLFGLVGMAFARSAHGISHWVKSWVKYPPLRPAVGGAIVTAGIFALHTTKYIGLGSGTIADSFTGKSAPWDWIGKFGFTVMSVGSGLKGGEVTPLFYIGSTLGNALSRVLPLPAPLLAGMGFTAVFAGAANTPIASTLLAAELFGSDVAAYAGIACVVSYLFSGHHGIYTAQRVGSSKVYGMDDEEDLPLGTVAKNRATAPLVKDEEPHM